MRILHITKRYWPYVGGVERYVEDLARTQAAGGHDVTVLTIDRDVLGATRGRLPASEDHGSVHVRRVRAIGGQRKQLLAEMPGTILRLLRESDVVHHHDPRFLFELTIATRRLIGKPVIAHTHGLFSHTAYFRRLKTILMRLYYGPVFGHLVSTVIADSSSDRGILVDRCGVPPKRIRLFLNALDLREFRAIDRHPEHGRVLVFGRIDSHKGHADLFRVLARIGGPWRLDVAGTGPEATLDALRGLAAELAIGDRLTWHGRVESPSLARLLRETSLVVFPSRFEGFGLALVEAMAAGCNVIASDLPSHREILGDDLADLIVDFDDPAVASRLATTMRRGAGEMRAVEARVRARAEMFSIDRLVAQIDGLYVELGLSGEPALKPVVAIEVDGTADEAALR